LAALPEDALQRLASDLKTVAVEHKQVFHRQNERIQHVYFPNDGVSSVTVAFSGGVTVEAATVGNEGMIGSEAYMADDALSQGQTMLQVPGTTMQRLSVEAFRREVRRQGALQEVMGRYVQAFMAHIMYSIGCNALHSAGERCARWLLHTHDRVQRDDFHLSHELLAAKLGISRPTVTLIAGTLQSAGLISYVHAHVTVLDRSRLEDASCECYGIIRGQFERLMTPTPRPRG
jgi:CRP-like cAMP-binding protein